MRLRKAIEFIVLTEAILRYRFKKKRSLRRFSRATGLSADQAYPEIVWDYLWVEPINLCVSSPARNEDLEAIMEQVRSGTVGPSQPKSMPAAAKGMPTRLRNEGRKTRSFVRPC